MLNSNGLCGKRDITFSHEIRKTPPFAWKRSRLLGCAVVYDNKETYISDIQLLFTYDFLHDSYKFIFEDGRHTTNHNQIKFFKSDDNDELELYVNRISLLENDYNIELKSKELSLNKNILSYYNSLLDSSILENQKETILDLYIKKLINFKERFLNVLHGITLHYNDGNSINIYSKAIESRYIQNLNINDEIGKIYYNNFYVKIDGVDNLISVCDKNLTYIYDDVMDFGTFKERFERGELDGIIQKQKQ